MNQSTSRLIDNNQGQGLTEYIILLMLVSVISITAVSTLGHTVRDKIQEASKAINSNVSSDPNKGAGNESGRGWGN
jgi:Flp pilus assembly pilin Flp